jgi:hypothetical protein
MNEILKNFVFKIRETWDKYPFFASTGVFGLVFLVYFSIYFKNPGTSAVDDHFFHFKMAYLLRMEGWSTINSFDWIHLATDERGYIHYPLSIFQISLIPFTYFHDLIFGLKMSDIFWGSLSVGIFYFTLRKLELRFPLVFTTIIFSSGFIVGRLLLGRAYVLILGLVFLELYLALEKKYKKLFLIFLLHVLWHPLTFFFPAVIAIIVETARYLVQCRYYLKNIIAGTAASILGAIVYAGSLANVWEWIRNLLGIHSFLTQGGTNVEGTELYTKDLLGILEGSNLFLLLLTVGFSVCFYYYMESREKREKQRTEKEDSLRVALYAAFIFLLMSLAGTILVSGRFYDFYFPGVVFLTAIWVTMLAKHKKIAIESSLLKFIFAASAAFFLFLGANNLINLNLKIATNDYKPMARVAEWIASKSENKDLVYLKDWSYFPVAFFYNSKNRYTMGIEPRAAFLLHPQLYWKWYNIYAYGIYCEQERDCKDEKEAGDRAFAKANDEDKNKMSKKNSKNIIESIKNDFGVHYVIADENLGPILKLNPELIADGIDIKSEYGKVVYSGFELK